MALDVTAGAAAPTSYLRLVQAGDLLFRLIWQESARGPRLRYLALPNERHPTAFWPPTERTCPEIDALARQLQGYLAGEAVTFDLSMMALETCKPFQQKVLLAEYAIPRGSVSTYGLVARHIGQAGAARAVGRALGTNPFPLIIPCHRAVRADGQLCGYRGGLEMKRRLLEMEGVRVSAEGRVLVAQYHYQAP